MSQNVIPRGLQGPPLSEYKEPKTKLGIGSFGIVLLYLLRAKPWYVLKRDPLPDKLAVKRITLLDQFGGNISRELQLNPKLTHSNVIQVHGAKTDKYFLYIKIELADYDLSELKGKMKKAKFTSDEVEHFGYQITCGLSYLHENSVTHRDHKPQNILACLGKTVNAPLTSSITLKLSDFGLSQFVPDGSVTATVVGTRSYMAPEVARAIYKQEKFHGDYKKADIFSAGVI